MATFNYDEMSLEELNKAAGEHHEAMLAEQAKLVPGLSIDEQLQIHGAAQVHRAHLNVINPLRTERAIEAELLASQQAQRLANMSTEEWNSLKKFVEAEHLKADTKIHTPV